MTIWEKLYKVYLERDCEKFKKLFSKLSQKDKESPYFSYYASLQAKVCKDQEKKGKLTYKGKVIKCPSCGAALTLSEYNKEQIKKLKNGADGVVFVCEYCGNKFHYSRKPFKTIFTDYKVGQIVKIKGKEYVLAGAVRYKGRYVEGNEGGELEYIEWLAYDKNGNLYYISESKAQDPYGVYYEKELSRKVDYPFQVRKYTTNIVETNKGNFPVKEVDRIKVESFIGNLNKSYKIGEEVILLKFKKYDLEEERGENYVERNLYESENVNSLESDSYTEVENVNSLLIIGILVSPLMPLAFSGFIYKVILSLGFKLPSSVLILLTIFFSIIVLAWIYWQDTKNWKGALKVFIYSLLFCISIGFGYLGYKLSHYTLDKKSAKTVVYFKENGTIDTGAYEYKFFYPSYHTVYRQSYDYGGKEYKQYILQGFYFAVNNKKDQETFKIFVQNPQKYISSWQGSKGWYYSRLGIRDVNYLSNDGFNLKTKRHYPVASGIKVSEKDLIIKMKKGFEK